MLCACRALLLATVLAACGGSPSDPGDRVLRVLYLGNSLTGFQDVPQMVQALADSAGRRPLELHAVASPGLMLRDHWASSPTRDLLERGGPWDLVILQERAIVSDTGRAYLREMVELMSAATSAPIAVMAVWAPQSAPAYFETLYSIVLSVASATQARVIPAGEAWRIALRDAPWIQLYADDMYPSEAGGYLTALVTFHAIYRQPLVGLPPGLALTLGGRLELDAATALALQQAATQAVARH
jgi:hypothetical protein